MVAHSELFTSSVKFLTHGQYCFRLLKLEIVCMGAHKTSLVRERERNNECLLVFIYQIPSQSIGWSGYVRWKHLPKMLCSETELRTMWYGRRLLILRRLHPHTHTHFFRIRNRKGWIPAVIINCTLQLFQLIKNTYYLNWHIYSKSDELPFP